MRKTFAVGKLTGSTAHILLVDGRTKMPASPERPDAFPHPARTPDPKLPDPHTVH